MRPRIIITRKPTPPTPDPFDCLLCHKTVQRDPWNPDFERPPLCFRCSMDVPTRPQLPYLSHRSVESWGDFYRAHALLCAIDQEIRNVRRTHQHR